VVVAAPDGSHTISGCSPSAGDLVEAALGEKSMRNGIADMRNLLLCST
jgi:hypothetical protein